MASGSKQQESPSLTDDNKFAVDLIYSSRRFLGHNPYVVSDSNVFPLRVKIVARNANNLLVFLGKVDVFIIKVSNALSQGDDLFDLFDVKQEIWNAGSAIFDFGRNDFLPSVSKLFTRAWPPMNPDGDIMLIHRIGISPLVRGQSLGLSVLGRVIMDYSAGCSLVVTKPYPLQFEQNIEGSPDWNDLSLSSFSKNEKESSKKLIKYYSKLGFKRLGTSDHFATLPKTVFSAVRKLKLQSYFTLPEGLEEFRHVDEDEFFSL
jgi:hypothetical protein